MTNTLRENHTLLDLLKLRCTIEFPSGQTLEGDPETGYIDVYFDDTYLGCQELSEKGLDCTFADKYMYWWPELEQHIIDNPERSP